MITGGAAGAFGALAGVPMADGPCGENTEPPLVRMLSSGNRRPARRGPFPPDGFSSTPLMPGSWLSGPQPLYWRSQVRAMQAPPSAFFMRHRSVHMLCLTWQRFMRRASAGSIVCTNAADARQAKAAADTMDFHLEAVTGRLRISFLFV
jgi:hypothetical protein